MVIEKASRVRMHYTLKLEDGEVVESTIGGDPLEFEFGAGEIMPGLENEMQEMVQGEEKQIVISPGQGFGERNPDAVISVSREDFPQETPLEEGMMFKLRRDDGTILHATVADLGEEDMILDFNHPLAGMTLYFDIRIEEIIMPGT
jgi:FKBP-type peptidyl-prolyl cis-trans isomerase 2